MATNYTAATNQNFTIPTSGSDQFSRTHIEYLARAVDNHDHSSTKGLAVARLATQTYLGATSNANMTQGLTISQAGNDDQILAFKSSDVAHAMTSVLETDTFGAVYKEDAANGGLSCQGFSAGTRGLSLTGTHTTDNTAKTTAANGAVFISGQLKSGTDRGGLGADANILVLATQSTARFIFDAEGSAHGDVEFVAFDKYDDVALLDTLTAEFVRRADPVKGEFGSWLQEHKDVLQREGIVNFYDPNSRRAMVNFTRLAMLQAGAIRQLARRLELTEQRLAQLPAGTV